MKNQKGITLVSLVITIVVLLILAGVAISIVVNENGIFGHATNAATQWNAAVQNEQTQVQNALNYLNNNIPAGT